MASTTTTPEPTRTTGEIFYFNVSFWNVSGPAYTSVPVTLELLKQFSQLYYPGGDIAWVLTSCVLIWLMILGLSLFYGGVSEPRVALSMSWLPLMTACLVGVQWYLFGYSIAFSNWPSWSVTSTSFFGGSDGTLLHDSILRPVPATADNARDGPYIPEIVFLLFQGMFASFTAALVAGAAAWKDRPAAFLLFIMFWTTFVYDPISRSTWSPEGFSNTRGVLDFAGGTAVHICAAATVAAHCVYHKYLLRSYERLIPRFGRTIRHIFVQRSEAGPRRPEPRVKSIPDRIPLQQKEPPQVTNHVNILVGTIFLWLGWFGFNGGSALGANLRAGAACVSTHVAAVTGAVFHSISHAAVVYWWTRRSRNAANNAVANPVRAQDGHEMEDMAGGMVNRQSQNVVLDPAAQETPSFRFSVLEFCNGAIIALVSVTPAAGFIHPKWAPLFGIIPSILCSAAHFLNEWLEDPAYITVIHGVGGFVGMLMTGLFAQGSISALDGLTPATQHNGAFYGNPAQFGVQLADALAVTAYAFAMSLTLLVILEPLIYCFSTRNQRGQTRKFEYLENTRTTDTYVLMEGPGREQDRMTEVLFRQ